MNKRGLRSFLILFLILVIPLSIVAYFSGFFFESGITPCSPPPSMAVDGEANVKIYTWEDLNANGKIDRDEPPLPNVEIYLPYSSEPQYTDQQGYAETGEFKPGCPCECWKDTEVEMVVPEGYRSTTPIQQTLQGEGITVYFGFIRLDQ